MSWMGAKDVVVSALRITQARYAKRFVSLGEACIGAAHTAFDG